MGKMGQHDKFHEKTHFNTDFSEKMFLFNEICQKLSLIWWNLTAVVQNNRETQTKLSLNANIIRNLYKHKQWLILF